MFTKRKSQLSKATNGASSSTTTTTVLAPASSSSSAARPALGKAAQPLSTSLAAAAQRSNTTTPSAAAAVQREKERQSKEQKLQAERRKEQGAASGARKNQKAGKAASDRKDESLSKRRKLDKGKHKAKNQDEETDDEYVPKSAARDGRAPPRLSSGHPSKASPSSSDRRGVLSAASARSSEEADGQERPGTPVFERKGPLCVPRDILWIPPIQESENSAGVKIEDGAANVELPRCRLAKDVIQRKPKDFEPYFTDIDCFAEAARLEYPGEGAFEEFLLVKPKVKDQQDYQPIQDIIYTVRTIIDYFLTPAQALEHFKHVAGAASSSLAGGAFDFLQEPQASRAVTPISDTGTPEPSANGAAVLNAAKEPIIRALEKAFRRKNGRAFLEALEWFNSVIVELRSKGSIRENIIAMGARDGIPEAVWMCIAGQCYERTVGPRVDELKKYEAFSDNTYGELLPPFVAHIAALTDVKPDTVVVDLGSGVGNCAVQMALATGCSAYGFENQVAASSIAAEQVIELSARARLWGVRPSLCETHEADFLASPLVPKILQKADVVIVNNYVFSPMTNESLSLLFLELKDGAKVVSLKPFVHGGNGGQSGGVVKITERNVGSPAAILEQSKPIVYERGSVSWTGEKGVFYIATVNRERVKRWLERNGLAG